MAVQKPLVIYNGRLSQLPPGDTISGAVVANVVAGSGLVGGGDLNTGNKELNLALATNPSGLIFVNNAVGYDGVALTSGLSSLANSNAAFSVYPSALATGVAAQQDANACVVSGNAALTAAQFATIFDNSAIIQASATVTSGSPVGFDDTGRVRPIVLNTSTDRTNSITFGATSPFNTQASIFHNSTYNAGSKQVLIGWNNTNRAIIYAGTINPSFSSFSVTASGLVSSGTSNTSFNIVDLPARNTFCCTYRDNTNSRIQYYRFGAVSGSEISFGTPIGIGDIFSDSQASGSVINYSSIDDCLFFVLQSGGGGLDIQAIRPTDTLTSVAYTQGNRRGFSETSLINISSFPTVSTAYDVDNNRMAVFFRNAANSNRGWGSLVNINTGDPRPVTSTGNYYNFTGTSVLAEVDSIYDTVNKVFVIGYSDATISGRGTAIIGTTSGNAINFGSASVFETGAVTRISLAQDYINNKVVFTCVDSGNSNYGTTVVGTVSGNTISFQTPAVFNSASTNYTATTFDPISKQILISYANAGVSNQATTIVMDKLYQNTYFPVRNSSNNYVGIAQNAATSGNSITVLLPKSVDFSRTNLITGETYYLDPVRSGITTTSTEPITWSGAYPWRPIGRAISSSGLYLVDVV